MDAHLMTERVENNDRISNEDLRKNMAKKLLLMYL